MFLGPQQSLVPTEDKVRYCSKLDPLRRILEVQFICFFTSYREKPVKNMAYKIHITEISGPKIWGDGAYILYSGVRIPGSQQLRTLKPGKAFSLGIV